MKPVTINGRRCIRRMAPRGEAPDKYEYQLW